MTFVTQWILGETTPGVYLAPARSRLFAALPEVEIPRGFDREAARSWLARIPAGPRRKAVTKRLEALLRRRR